MEIGNSHSSVKQFSSKSQILHIFRKLQRVFFFLAGLVLFPQLLSAQWNAAIGAQSQDFGRQGLAFLPNEIWIHAGDSITWTVEATEPHTVTFLTDGQIRPPFNVGCPGFSKGSAVFDGSSCITSTILFKD